MYGASNGGVVLARRTLECAGLRCGLHGHIFRPADIVADGLQLLCELAATRNIYPRRPKDLFAFRNSAAEFKCRFARTLEDVLDTIREPVEPFGIGPMLSR
jgi:hypothetical protein